MLQTKQNDHSFLIHCFFTIKTDLITTELKKNEMLLFTIRQIIRNFISIGKLPHSNIPSDTSVCYNTDRLKKVVFLMRLSEFSHTQFNPPLSHTHTHARTRTHADSVNLIFLYCFFVKKK